MNEELSVGVLQQASGNLNMTTTINEIIPSTITIGYQWWGGKWCMRITEKGDFEFNPELLSNKDELIKSICESIEETFGIRHKQRNCYCISASHMGNQCRERGYVFARDAEEAKQKVIDWFAKNNAHFKEIIKCEIAKPDIVDFYVTFFIE